MEINSRTYPKKLVKKLSHNALDLANKKFGFLTVIYYAGSEKGCGYWRCVCDCGTTLDVITNRLTRGETRSCGCLQRKVTRERSLTHGMTGHPVYHLFHEIKKRCYNSNSQFYKNYGGRGIKMDSLWLENQQLFFDWCLNNGWKKGLEIERINVNGNYEPSNCKFIKKSEQNNNTTKSKFYTVNGKSMLLKDICREFDISYSAISTRLHRRNISIEDAIKFYTDQKVISLTA